MAFSESNLNQIENFQQMHLECHCLVTSKAVSRLPVDNRLFSFALMLFIASLYIASRNACNYCATFYCRHCYLLLGDDIQWGLRISNCPISKIRLIASS